MGRITPKQKPSLAWIAFALLAVLALLGGLQAGRARADLPALHYLPYIGKALLPTPTQTSLPGAKVDLSVGRVELIQGITMGEAYKVYIAHRPAILRVFVKLSGTVSQGYATARLTRYVNDRPQKDTLSAGPTVISQVTNEGDLKATLNFSLPTGWLSPGLSYTIEIDPGNAISETDEANNRYPASGAQPFNFVEVLPLEVVLVPVDYQPPAGKHTLPNTSRDDYLSWMPVKVYPVSAIHYTWHIPFLWKNTVSNNGAGWGELLTAIEKIHSTEDPAMRKVYYGVINTYAANGCASGCVVGLGYIGHPTSLGFSGFTNTTPGGESTAGETLTHEVGHNFGRSHVRCNGGEAGYDKSYPYSGGKIGRWGLDVLISKLYNPSTIADYMSYCTNTWTSDYTYYGIFNFRKSTQVDLANLALQDTLSLDGSFDDKGQVQMLPLYRQPGIVLLQENGTHKVELWDAAGQLLAIYPFTPLEIADAIPGKSDAAKSWGIHLTFPYMDGIATLRVLRPDGSLLFERQHAHASDVGARSLSPLQSVQDAGRNLRLSWNAVSGATYRVRFSTNGGASWQVLALDLKENTYTFPASLLAGTIHPQVEVQASDGLQTNTQVWEVPNP